MNASPGGTAAAGLGQRTATLDAAAFEERFLSGDETAYQAAVAAFHAELEGATK